MYQHMEYMDAPYDWIAHPLAHGGCTNRGAYGYICVRKDIFIPCDFTSMYAGQVCRFLTELARLALCRSLILEFGLGET